MLVFGEPDSNDREVKAYETVLSGDIGSEGISDNSYHVVTSNGTNVNAILDGFTFFSFLML